MSPSAGWHWMNQAIVLFRKRPFEIIFAYFGMLLCTFLVASVPLLGPILSYAVAPMFLMGLAQICRDTERNEPYSASALFVAFRSPARKSLFILGLLQFVAFVASMVLASMCDGGFLREFASNPKMFDVEAAQNVEKARQFLSSLFQSLAISRVFYLPALICFWYAPNLIAWHGMGVFKACFYSFFSVWRLRSAFVVYLLTCIGMFVLPSFLMGALAAIHPIFSTIVSLLMFPVMFAVMAIINCSFYTTYAAAFEREQSA